MRFSIGVQFCLPVLAHLDAAVGKSDAVLSGGGVPVAVLVLVEVDAGVVVLDGVGVVVDGRGDGLLLVGTGRGVGRRGRGVGAGLVWAGQGNGGQGEDEEDRGEADRRGLVGGWRERGRFTFGKGWNRDSKCERRRRRRRTDPYLTFMLNVCWCVRSVSSSDAYDGSNARFYSNNSEGKEEGGSNVRTACWEGSVASVVGVTHAYGACSEGACHSVQQAFGLGAQGGGVCPLP